MLSVDVLSVIMLSVIMLSVIMLSVIILNVVAPKGEFHCAHHAARTRSQSCKSLSFFYLS
jgi:hypothetical protein